MRFDLLTIHPGICDGPLKYSILGRGQKAGLFEIGINDIREHGIGRHKTVDHTPYGGGSGMVMRVDVLNSSIESIRKPESKIILMDPAGKPFKQADADRLSKEKHLIFVCGHYEGVDARIEHLIDERISLGDFVLTGGEIPAMAMIDAIARLLPGVLGNPESLEIESHTSELLEAPVYTKPRVHQGWSVPDVLLGGHHQRIIDWRKQQSLRITKERRPDLYQKWLDKNNSSE